MTPRDLIDACRCPHTIPTGNFGVWQLNRFGAYELDDPRGRAYVCRMLAPYDSYTVLRRLTMATMMSLQGTVVMEDSYPELAKHLPILMVARGRVLVTGLGLGCVVRGLLSRPDVEHIDVVELDRTILEVVGPEFAENPRVTLHQGDAETCVWRGFGPWDYAWHDLWTEEEHLDLLHARVLARFRGLVGRQGCWGMDRQIKRKWPDPLLGAARRRVA